MDLSKVLAEIEEAHKAMSDAAEASGAAPENQKLAEDISNARWDFLWLLCDHAPLLLAALKVAIARNNERGVMVWHSGMGDATEQAEAAFKALAEGE